MTPYLLRENKFDNTVEMQTATVGRRYYTENPKCSIAHPTIHRNLYGTQDMTHNEHASTNEYFDFLKTKLIKWD